MFLRPTAQAVVVVQREFLLALRFHFGIIISESPFADTAQVQIATPCQLLD